jgi:hypothetical protein
MASIPHSYETNGSTPGNTYDMDITVIQVVPTCLPDLLEPNDTDVTATPITPGTFVALTACDADDDYDAVDLSTGDEITVDLLFLNDEGERVGPIS